MVSSRTTLERILLGFTRLFVALVAVGPVVVISFHMNSYTYNRHLAYLKDKYPIGAKFVIHGHHLYDWAFDKRSQNDYPVKVTGHRPEDRYVFVEFEETGERMAVPENWLSKRNIPLVPPAPADNPGYLWSPSSNRKKKR